MFNLPRTRTPNKLFGMSSPTHNRDPELEEAHEDQMIDDSEDDDAEEGILENADDDFKCVLFCAADHIVRDIYSPDGLLLG